MSEPIQPTDLEIYLFDLRGYLILENAISPAELTELNRILDTVPPLKQGEWWGNVHAHSFSTTDGLNLQQIYEAGEPFECAGAVWRFEIEEVGPRSRLRFSVVIGERNNLTSTNALADPDQEGRVLAGRRKMMRTAMTNTIEGIRALAEQPAD